MGLSAQPSTTQNINLTSGWNLISIQVGNAPIPVASFQAAMLHPERLIEIWGYQPTGNPAVPGSWKVFKPALAVTGFVSDLTAL